MVSRFEGPLSRGIRILYLISKEFAGYLCWFTTHSFAKPGPGSFPDLAIFFGGGPSYFLGKCNDCREIECSSSHLDHLPKKLPPPGGSSA